MFRIDSAGATVGNRFTEGDPVLSVPATVVSDEWLNSVQEEIVKPVEQMGIALDKGNEGQLWEGLLALYLGGGRALKFTDAILNNSTDNDLEDSNNADALFSVFTDIHSMRVCIFSIERSTDTSTVKEYGLLFISYNVKSGAFEFPKRISLGDDAGVTFKLLQVGATTEYKMQYDSDDLAGATYAGNVEITSIIDIKQ